MKNIFLILIISPILMFAQEEPFKRVEEMPRFPGCEEMKGDTEQKRLCSNQKLIDYIYNNVEYPEQAKKEKIEGTVVIQFIVDENGKIKNPKVARDIGGNCGEEALRVVKSIRENNIYWRPGVEQGKVVEVLFTLPINFKLT